MKHVFALIVLFLSLSINAQPTPEKKAKKIADEYIKVLSLNEEDSKAIYKIQLDRFTESDSIDVEFANDPEAKKEKMKVLGNKVYNQVKDFLGKDRLVLWREYKSKK